MQEKESEHEEKKRQYDALTLQLESSMSRVEQEVKKFQEEVLSNETKHRLLELKNRNLELLLQRAQDEIKLYVSSKAEDKKKSVREQLLKQVKQTWKARENSNNSFFADYRSREKIQAPQRRAKESKR